MLNKSRYLLDAVLDALRVSSIPLGPNTITLIALVISLGVPLLAYTGSPPHIVALVLLASAFLDGLDGYIARKRGLKTPFGAFLDSTVDRISDALYTCTLAIVGVADVALTYVLLAAEYVVSYARARAESLGASLAGVGLMERGERTVFKVLILLIASLNIEISKGMAFLLTALTILTAGQRVVMAKKLLEHSELQ